MIFENLGWRYAETFLRPKIRVPAFTISNDVYKNKYQENISNPQAQHPTQYLTVVDYSKPHPS
tara:strand:- start:278 stop:466 length:189 start_codon:yes stop_codon:yes gene_type:complete